MREPKVGDKIVVTKFDGEVIEPVIREIVEIDSEHPFMLMNATLGDGNRVIEHPDWVWNDEWRYAVRKGDRLVVTKMDGEDVEPTVVTATEDEPRDHLVLIDNECWHILSTYNDSESDDGGGDEWYFAEDYVAEHFTGVPEDADIVVIESVDPISDICDSFNAPSKDVVVSEMEDDEGVDPYQSYSEFNASKGGGKTLKDYTGVDITPETLGFVPKHEKVLEGITGDSLAFKENDEDAVNHPSHYTQGNIEVIDMLEELAGSYSDPVEGYLAATVGKYLFRAEHKGNKTQDIGKAIWYLNRLKERMED